MKTDLRDNRGEGRFISAAQNANSGCSLPLFNFPIVLRFGRELVRISSWSRSATCSLLSGNRSRCEHGHSIPGGRIRTDGGQRLNYRRVFARYCVSPLAVAINVPALNFQLVSLNSANTAAPVPATRDVSPSVFSRARMRACSLSRLVFDIAPTTLRKRRAGEREREREREREKREKKLRACRVFLPGSRMITDNDIDRSRFRSAPMLQETVLNLLYQTVNRFVDRNKGGMIPMEFR